MLRLRCIITFTLLKHYTREEQETMSLYNYRKI